MTPDRRKDSGVRREVALTTEEVERDKAVARFSRATPLAVVVNNARGRILPSETFLRAHIENLGLPTVPIIGAPNSRFLVNEGFKALSPQGGIARAHRWLRRRVLSETAATQDGKALYEFLRDRGVRAVLAEYGPTAVTVMNACRDAGVPLVSHFHGFDAYRAFELERHVEGYQDLFRLSSAVVVVSSDMRRKLEGLGAPANRLWVNPCGPRLPEDRWAAPQLAACRFVMVGRLVEKKAPMLSIRAFAKVAERFPQATLDVIGKGPLLDDCRCLADELGVTEKITFHGARAHEAVFQTLLRARCFIQHSVTAKDGDREGTPVGVMEAMGLGLPVVSTRHGGIVDIIEDGVTGSLVDEFDLDAMTRAMLIYAESPEKAAAVGKAAREWILRNCTMEQSLARLRDIILQAACNGSPAR